MKGRILKRLTRTVAVIGVVLASLVPTEIAQAQTNGKGMTFEGDTALLTVAIKPDKTADYERLMRRLQEALTKSENPERRQQAQGWKLVRIQQPLADGTVAYLHVIHPVVPGAAASIMPALYDAFPEERQAVYDLYVSAVAKTLSLATGNVAVDLGKP